MSDQPGSLVITSAREFTASREALFAAFTDPARLPLWWGPKGFRNTFHHFDLRTGGQWRYTMHGPDGTDYENVRDFLEVDPPRRIVMKNPEPAHEFTMTMTYEERGERTLLTWVMEFTDGPGHAAHEAFILAANEENFDRLEAHVAEFP